MTIERGAEFIKRGTIRCTKTLVFDASTNVDGSLFDIPFEDRVERLEKIAAAQTRAIEAIWAAIYDASNERVRTKISDTLDELYAAREEAAP